MRTQVSTRTRFEIFKRDGFTCQYCGATPPSVILHVDHIVAVKNGGRSDRDNLITSCSKCNLGKSAVPLSSVPQSLAEKAAQTKEAEKQLKGFRNIFEAKRRRMEEDCWEIVQALEGADQSTYRAADLNSINRFLEKLPFHEVLEAAERTRAKFSYIGAGAFKYFCGICWKKIREQGNGESQKY